MSNKIKEGDHMFNGTNIPTKLLEWLRLRWRRDNHAKYQQYFEEWVSNITEDQILAFDKQMYNLENNVLGAKKWD